MEASFDSFEDELGCYNDQDIKDLTKIQALLRGNIIRKSLQK